MTFIFIPSYLNGDYRSLYVKCALVAAFWGFMIIAVLIDLWTGVERARAVGEKMRSNKFRCTIEKIGDYWRILAFALMLDIIGSVLPFYKLPYVSILAAVACILIEAKSVFENLRAKKSVASKMPELMKQLAECTDPEKLKELLSKIFDLKDKHSDGRH